MAKAIIENRERAILDAAVTIFAERGFWNTPTSLISRTAGVAEGTLFTYFKTKHDLMNQLYLDIKRELSQHLLEGFTEQKGVENQMRHLWDRYIGWGLANLTPFRVFNQIASSYPVDEAVKAQGNEPFIELQRIAQISMDEGALHPYPVDFVAAMMNSLAVTTIEFIVQQPDQTVDYRLMGFALFLKGIMR